MSLSTRATLETLALMVVTFVVQQVVLLVSSTLHHALFVLQSPLPLLSPWTLVTSVYAHGSVLHLVGNAVVLVAFGLAVEQVSNRWRFHTFFVLVGAAAGVCQMLFAAIPFLPGADGVLGASGAILGLVGYAVAGNDVADTAVSAFDLDVRAQLAALAVVAAGITLWMHASGVASIGHFSGLLVGLAAGRGRLLHVDQFPNRR
jgi:membrane associated rhomboid family serine protease